MHNALARVLRLHPVLFAVPVLADNQLPYWGRLPSIDLKQCVSVVERCLPSSIDDKGRDRELDALLEKQHNISFKSGYGTVPVWRLIILRDHGVMHQLTACFIAHHSMTDGTGLQIFQKSFQQALCNVSSGTPPLNADHIIFSKDDPIAPSLEELHPLPIQENASQPNTTATEEWTGSPVEVPCSTRYESLFLSPQVMKAFALECRKHKVAPTAALPSLVARLLYDTLPSTAESVTCNLPVSLRGDLPPKMVNGVLGNFIDAFKVKLLRSDLDEHVCRDSGTPDSIKISSSMGIWNHAWKIQDATTRYLGNISPSGEAYTNVAIFKVIPDIAAALSATVGNARGESFEVSNMGTFSDTVHSKSGGHSPIWRAGNVLLSRGAYAAGGPLVICVISSEENVGLGFTWQQGSMPDSAVEDIISNLREYFTSFLA